MTQMERIQQELCRREMQALLLLSPEGRFFATGFPSSAGAVLITREKGWLLTDSRYIEAAGKKAVGCKVELVTHERSYAEVLSSLLRQEQITTLGFEEEVLTVSQFVFYRKRLPAELIGAQEITDRLRAVKQAEEIAAIRRSQEITERAWQDLLRELRPGMTEREAAARLTYALLHHGAEEMAFDPIVVSGPNSSLPHGVPTERVLEYGDFLTADFGARNDGYCADMTRTVAVGTVTDEMSKVYDTVLQAQKAGIAAARAGVPGRDVDRAGRSVIERAGYGAYFGHGFGHGLGIQVHEGPGASASEGRPLPAGQVISAEPGIYLPGRFGVRIEDLLLITENGNENLTSAPKELVIL